MYSTGGHNIIYLRLNSGLAFKLDTKIMVVELSEPPTFSAKEEGKWVKVFPLLSAILALQLNYERYWISLKGTHPTSDDTTSSSTLHIFRNTWNDFLSLILD
jgi:hypothetical protein